MTDNIEPGKESHPRLFSLLQLLDNYPSDPFSHYAVALEYRHINPDKAIYYFSELINRFPDYLPAYYPAALFFNEQNYEDKAIALWLQGIALAKAQGNLKTARELQSAMDINSWIMPKRAPRRYWV